MIVLADLQKVHDQNRVLDIPTLRVKGGEIAACYGTVDSGVDILFQLLIGKYQPTHGTVRVAGLNPYQERQSFSQCVGVLFTEDALYKRLSVRENLHFYCRLYRLPKTRAFEVMESVGLADQVNVIVDKLSPGLSRRLSIGRAILVSPQVLLLADPFSRCDQPSIDLISQVIRKQALDGVAVLIFTHEMTGLENLCDTIHHLENGRIVTSYNPLQEQELNRPFMIPARADEKIILLDPAEILYAFAQQDHTYLQTMEERWPTQFTLTELEKRLTRRGFFRAHRAYLVNLQQVKEVIPYTRDSFSLRLKDAAGTKIPLSKSAERELRELLKY